MEYRFRTNALVSGVDQKCGAVVLIGWVQELIVLFKRKRNPNNY